MYASKRLRDGPILHWWILISFRNLKDFVPESGGTPIRSIIIATWRSGSTFLGDVLNSVPGNYYHYEPLLDHGIVQVRGPPLANTALRYINQLLNCNYTDMGQYCFSVIDC